MAKRSDTRTCPDCGGSGRHPATPSPRHPGDVRDVPRRRPDPALAQGRCDGLIGRERRPTSSGPGTVSAGHGHLRSLVTVAERPAMSRKAGRPRLTVAPRRDRSPSWASFCSAPARLTLSPSTSPSQPSAFGLGDAGQQVAADLYDPLVLRRIRSKQPAWQATVLVDAARPVGSTAVAKGDPSPLEVAEGGGTPPIPRRWESGIPRWVWWRARQRNSHRARRPQCARC